MLNLQVELSNRGSLESLEVKQELKIKVMAGVTYKLSENGLKIIQSKIVHTGLTLEKWAEKTMISQSTIKRFLQGKPLRPDNFKSLCEILDIKDGEWEKLVDWEDLDSTLVEAPFSANESLPPSQSQKESSSGGNIAITGTFTEEKRQEIEICLEHLRTLMKSCTVTIGVVTGDRDDVEDSE